MDPSIAQVQEKKEHEILKKYKHVDQAQDVKEKELQREQSAAARTLQRTYRGHRARRELRGLSLDPSTRWVEAVKEAQYLELTTPRPRSSARPSDSLNHNTSDARQNWSRIGKIARRAGGDEESSLSSSLSDNDASSLTQKEARRRKRLAAKQERNKSAKQMDLSYFLEMVDVKHRYGSNLRKYHAEWQSRPTKENFFYWLDQGEGKDVEVEKCSRERLEHMQVRYLGREERRCYEVVIDGEGKLCWRKDGVRVDTSDKWRDSIKGIVRVDDPTPAWAHRPAMLRGSSESSGVDSEGDQNVSLPASPVQERKQPLPMAEIRREKEPETPKSATSRHQSLNDLFRRPSEVKGEKRKEKKQKKQKWIFVADVHNNLYIGIKQSGAFQHSSFLHGARASAAGLITVKDGQLRILQPRSGHYKTPSHNLHILIKSLQSRHVDMSRTAIGSTYAVMVGIETFMKSRGKLRKLKEGFGSLTFKDKDKEKEKEKEGG
ncbi:hypothetical protein OEA41_008517 [Lepraria neglecta]|uniref:Uncharacterized protein n=1 Tax=Lepraria neglecta TaxID=209136 RepID=A0AAD9ZFY3_9LECA|nr:hypothetical protein OEA41_008517 [Lepraria neglecta]